MLVEFALAPGCDLRVSTAFRRATGYTHLEIPVVVAYQGDSELYKACNMPAVPGVCLSILLNYGFLCKLKRTAIFESVSDSYAYLPGSYRRPNMWTPLAVACVLGYEELVRHILDVSTLEELLPFIHPEFHGKIMEKEPKLRQLLLDSFQRHSRTTLLSNTLNDSLVNRTT